MKTNKLYRAELRIANALGNWVNNHTNLTTFLLILWSVFCFYLKLTR